jgi:dihydrofolate reductase
VKISFVVAVAANGVIGHEGGMPWHLPRDLQHFKDVTMGHPIVMGRKTFESIGHPLPGRANIVVTRNADYEAPGASVVTSMADAYKVAGDAATEIMIIGGGEIFNLAMDRVTRMYLTDIHFKPVGDAFFTFDRSGWRETAREDIVAEDKAPAYSFITLEKD